MKLLSLLLNEPQPILDGPATSHPYFIAMQYKGLLNCIYKVFITDNLIMCAKVNGYITVAPNFGIGTSIPRNVMHNPEAYVNRKTEAAYNDAFLRDIPAFLEADHRNFCIAKQDITKMYINRNPKGGMGYYPYGGRIIITSPGNVYNSKAECEFILVGDQDPEMILAELSK